MPDHVGRLAPLVGLLAADEQAPDRLVDFLNPRRRAEEAPNHLRTGLMIGVPAAAVLLLGYLMFSHLKGLDQQIAELKSANASKKPQVDAAIQSIARTESIDKFLDGDVNWLDELRRLAKTMPSSDQMIVRSISANSDARSGGGTLKLFGAATTPVAIDDFEESLRDQSHRVVGDGASVQKNAKDAYRWEFTESITVTAESIRNGRYAAMSALLAEEEATPTVPSSPAPERVEADQSEQRTVAESPPDDSPPNQPASSSQQIATKESTPDEGAPVQSPPDEGAPVQSAPDEDAPVQSAPDEDAPVQSTPDEDAPVQSTPDGAEPTQPSTEDAEPAPANLAANGEVQS